MSSKLKIAFAGIRRASSFVRAFQSHPETEIVALCDLYQPTLTDAGAALGVDKLYTVYEQMLDEVKPDAVVVATPMQYHAAQSIAALERDIHVLSEVTAAATKGAVEGIASYFTGRTQLATVVEPEITERRQIKADERVRLKELEPAHEATPEHGAPAPAP